MNHFVSCAPSDFDPIFDRIGKETFLISAAANGRANIMTASWGCCGVLWNRPIAVCMIRPQRYTFELMESAELYSLAFLKDTFQNALRYCGTHSGRSCDKFAAAGLHCSYTENGTPYPAESREVLICRKLYADKIKPEAFCDPALSGFYPEKDFHKVFVGEILEYWRAE